MGAIMQQRTKRTTYTNSAVCAW